MRAIKQDFMKKEDLGDDNSMKNSRKIKTRL